LIYVDTSVVLAQLLAEDRHPASGFWDQDGLISSRLLEYEAWTRIHARGLGTSHGEDLRDLLARLSFLELVPPVLARALEPFPVPMRTLDALHLASVDFLMGLGQRPSLATYDRRLAATASAIGIPILDSEMVRDAPARDDTETMTGHRQRDGGPDLSGDTSASVADHD
jgi:predicted nucleic acid-binding protein